MKARWRKTSDGAVRLRIGDRPALACVYKTRAAGWEWWALPAHRGGNGLARTQREAKAAAELAVRDALAEMTEAMEVLRNRIVQCEQLRAERNRLIEALAQAVHGHSGAGAEPACETTADAAGWGMW